MPKVGNNARDYNNFRNINSVPFGRYEFVRVYDWYNILNFSYFKLFNKNHQYYLNNHWDAGLNKADILHFFNKISHSNTPWVTTFETALPRYDTASEKGMRLMAGKSCKKLLAMSRAAYDIQLHFLEKFPSIRDEVVSKMDVLHPGQKLLIESYSDKPLNMERVEFTLIGNQIFSKGGREAVSVTRRLYKEGYPVRLNLVSAMLPDNYATFTTEKDVAPLMKAIESSKDCINFLGRIPNSEVLALLKRTHVSLLPTYADTYGYAVLEAQAAGCPVISTDIRALAEINDSAWGWQIPVPKDELTNGVLKTEKDRENFYRKVEEGLYHSMKEALDHPERVREKGEKSLERIKTHHNPARKAEYLERLYDEALGL